MTFSENHGSRLHDAARISDKTAMTETLLAHFDFEREADLARRSRAGSLAQISLLLVACYTLWEVSEFFEALAAVGAAIFVGNIARFFLCHFQDVFYPNRRRLWLALFSATLLLTSCGWGLICALTVHLYGFVHASTSILLLITSGVCAAATTSFLPSRRHANLFIISTFALPVGYFIWLGTSISLTFTAVFLTYCLFLLAQVRMQGGEYKAALAYKRQILEDKQRLEVATKVKSEFLANMSHEIRTPLNGIIGMTTLLVDSKLNREQGDFVKTIRNCGEQLLGIVNDVLDFSKIEAGRLELEKQKFDLHECLNTCRSVVSHRAREKGLALAIKIEDGVPRAIVSDSGRLSQIIINLLSNAMKFTESGGVTVSAAASALDDDQVEIRFAVRDTGIGIPTERQSSLFTSFTQVDASTSRRFGGTGLGLAICKSLTELLGGKIWLKSEYGQGSTFYFTIRAEVPAGSASEAEAPRPAASAPAKNELQAVPQFKLHVLAVDDNVTNLTLAVKLLEKFGCTSETAANGREAVDAVLRQPYDLVLMDIQMPEMSGIEATREIHRRMPEGERPPIVALTANATAEDRMASHSAGMTDHLSKPIRIAELKRVLENAARQRKAA